MSKKEEWKNPTGRLLDSGCFAIDIKKLSNASVLEPGNDQMDRYKVTHKGRIYQILEINGYLQLRLVGFVLEKNIAVKTSKAVKVTKRKTSRKKS